MGSLAAAKGLLDREFNQRFKEHTLPPIIMEVNKWVHPIIVTFQIQQFFAFMIMGERVESNLPQFQFLYCFAFGK